MHWRESLLIADPCNYHEGAYIRFKMYVLVVEIKGSAHHFSFGVIDGQESWKQSRTRRWFNAASCAQP